MINWIKNTTKKILINLIILQIKIIEKKENQPLLLKYIEHKLNITTEQQLQQWLLQQITTTQQI